MVLIPLPSLLLILLPLPLVLLLPPLLLLILLLLLPPPPLLEWEWNLYHQPALFHKCLQSIHHVEEPRLKCWTAGAIHERNTSIVERIWEKNASHDDKAMWIAEVEANNQASVTHQQPVTITTLDSGLHRWRTRPPPDLIWSTPTGWKS